MCKHLMDLADINSAVKKFLKALCYRAQKKRGKEAKVLFLNRASKDLHMENVPILKIYRFKFTSYP